MKNKIDEVVTTANLRSEAGSRSYSRGEAYAQEGAVHHLYCDGEQLTADVQGTHLYRARIINDQGNLYGECSCPIGKDGGFCKHLVALGLTYLDNQKHAPAEKNTSAFFWINFLKKCDKDELIKIILEMSPNNSEIIERYRMENLPTDGNARLRELKSKVEEIFRYAEDMEEYYDDDWIDYEDDIHADDFGKQSRLLLEVLNKLVKQKKFELLWDITAYAIGKFLDSSNAELDSVQEFVGELAIIFVQTVHAKVKSNDDVLRLFLTWEEKGHHFGYGIFSTILEALPAEIREKWAVIALEKWRGYPPCQLGEYAYDAERSYIERHLLTWANEHRDDKLKLQIQEKSLRNARDVSTLADEYRRQGMEEKIIPLLKKAYKELDGNQSITNLLTEELQKSGCDEQALNLAWDEFTKAPMHDESLNRLQSVSSKMKCWQDYYRKALAFLAKQDKEDGKRNYGYSNRYYYYNPTMRQRRVEVLFTHGDQQAAWDLAQNSNLSENCWLELADWRAKEAPQESASVVKKLLVEALIPTGEDAYRHVVVLLKLYRNYLQMNNQEADFTAYCANIRLEYKRRKLLMKQMNDANL